MSSARHTCNCDYCRDGRSKREDLVSIEDFDETPRYRRPKKRSRKVCAKSKTGEPCDMAGSKVKGTSAKYDFLTRTWLGSSPKTIQCCSRCGREHWW